MEVPVRELKNRLSEYLRRTRAGEVIVVTSHGKPVARLLPVSAEPRDEEASALERLRAQPWVRAGKGGKPLGARRPIAWPEGERTLSDLMLEDRG